MGDLFLNRFLSDCRSIWTTPLPGEDEAPEHRIIHARILKPHGKCRVRRIGLKSAQGLHKCASVHDPDWVRDLRILSLSKPNGEWEERFYQSDLPSPEPGHLHWLDLQPFDTWGLCLEIRRCGVDGWWTPWNLAEGAFIVEGDPLSVAPRNEKCLNLQSVSLDPMPDGLKVERRNGEVRFRSPFLKVGFYLNRPGFSYLAIDQDGMGRTDNCFLFNPSGAFHQGVLLAEIGQPPSADRAVRFNFEGSTKIEGNRIFYALTDPHTQQSYSLHWTVHPHQLELHVERESPDFSRSWQSAAWAISTAPSRAVCHAIGELDRRGQSGLLKSPFLIHIPEQGSLIVKTEGAGLFRFEAIRQKDRVDLEFKTGEHPEKSGEWSLLSGTHRCTWSLTVARPHFKWKPGTPQPVQSALTRAGHTGMTFRPDIGTLTNNGASMVCPISMDTWTTQALAIGDLLPGLPAATLVRHSLERWLQGGPGYASGNFRKDNAVHDAEDEYLMTAAAALVGLADFLETQSSPDWLHSMESPIRGKLQAMQKRDLDHDGLVESPYRTGVSGSGQWSTCWFDVISFGWKDSWSNALLFDALTRLPPLFSNSALSDWIPVLQDWANRLKAHYFETFFNPETGWLAGWRCKEDRLHDYAFLPANGCAVAVGLVDPETGKTILSRLLSECEKVGLPDRRLGLPGNLHPIPDSDLADIMQGYPFGYYQNGGRTLAQTRHFYRGLLQCGLFEEADRLLVDCCRGFSEENVFGPMNSGVDWRFWDDRPCGYEGLLTDQFGILGEALRFYGESEYPGGAAQPVKSNPQ